MRICQRLVWGLFRFRPLVLVAGTLSRRMICAIRLFFRAFRGSVSQDFCPILAARLTNKTIDNLRNITQNI
jgi:hypothetical protein